MEKKGAKVEFAYLTVFPSNNSAQNQSLHSSIDGKNYKIDGTREMLIFIFMYLTLTREHLESFSV